MFNWPNSTSLARTLSPRVLESQIDAKKVNFLKFALKIYEMSIILCFHAEML